MNDLLEIEVAVPYMAEVLTEVFLGGPEISLKVREDQVERLFHLGTTGSKEGWAELIITLQAMAKVCVLEIMAGALPVLTAARAIMWRGLFSSVLVLRSDSATGGGTGPSCEAQPGLHHQVLWQDKGEVL